MFSPRRTVVRAAVSITLAAAAVGGAQATDLATGTLQLTSASPTQLGRLSRDGVPSYWGDTTAPAVINPATTYHYRTLDLDLTTLEAGYTYGSFIQITFDSTSATTFLSAYLDSYSPTSILSNWIGDGGSSANYFGTDPVTFQVQVAAGHHLVLLLNESTTNGGLNQPGNFLVEAFSDTEYTDLAAPTVPAVPEPGTWALMAGGLGVLGLLRKRRTASRDAALLTSN